MPMSMLLEATGLNLDGPSLKPRSKHSLRHDGAILMLFIEYFNYWPWSFTPQKRFHYRVQAVPHSQAKETSVRQSVNPQERSVVNEHGIRVNVIQGGELSRLSLFKLLLTMTTCLTLVAVARVTVDAVASYIIPEKGHFVNHKYPVADLRRAAVDTETDESDCGS